MNKVFTAWRTEKVIKTKNARGIYPEQCARVQGFAVSKRREKRYSRGMDFAIDFNSDAFKHGVNEADIRKAFDTAIYDGFLDEPSDDDARDKYLLIGFDCNANPIEILYNFITDYHVNVFHAMPCRDIYHHLLYL